MSHRERFDCTICSVHAVLLSYVLQLAHLQRLDMYLCMRPVVLSDLANGGQVLMGGRYIHGSEHLAD